MRLSSRYARPQADYHLSILQDENTRRLLRFFIALVLGSSLLYLAALPFSDDNVVVLRAMGVVAVDLCALGAFWHMRHGRMNAAVALLIWGIWASILLQVGITNGLKSRTLVAVPIVIVMGGWLLPPRGAIVLCIATVLAGLALALAELAGRLPLVVSPSPPPLAWLAISIYVVLSAVIAYHIFRGFRRRHIALAAREAELTLLMESVPSMIFHGDRNKRCIYANRAYAEFYVPGGRRPTGRTVREIVGEEAYVGLDERLNRVLAGERLAYHGVRKSARGEWRTLDIELLPEVGECGEVKGFFAVIKDVTDRVQAEDELRSSEHKFASVFRSSPLAVDIARLADGRYLDVNDAFVRLFGWRREEAIGRTSLDLGKWVSSKARTEWSAALRRDGRVTNLEADFRTRSGEVRRVLLSSELIEIADEPCVLMMTADITGLRRAEADLRESEARLREAQRIGRIGSWEMDLLSHRLHWSEEVYRIFESTPEAFGGTFAAFLETVHPDDLPAIREVYRKSLETEGASEADHRILTPDGCVKHVREHWEVFRDEAGKPVRSVGTILDITEQVLARREIQNLNTDLERRVRERTAELTAANRELEAFAYSISHDLRAPLRGIDGFSHLLAEEYGERLDEQGRDYLGRVRRAAQRMGSLIDDILELSRVTRQEMQRASVDLSELARDILDELARGAPERRVRTVLAAGCVAYGDPALLRVLMQNLLENAWKYSARQPAPSIEFGCEVENGERVFHVRDNGAGFDMKYAERLFVPFRRLHSPEEFEGTGIGLATVLRVVQRHGGRIWAESSPGKGALFKFTLGEAAAPAV